MTQAGPGFRAGGKEVAALAKLSEFPGAIGKTGSLEVGGIEAPFLTFGLRAGREEGNQCACE